MFCPRCSQEQVSEETKFCSRCGFPLGLVSEVLAHGGFLPQLAELNKSKTLFTRKNGLMFALFWFMIFTLILLPIIGATHGPKEIAATFALLGTMGGLVLVVASFAFLKTEPKHTANFNQNLPNHKVKNLYESQQNALPPQLTQPAQTYVSPANSWKAPDTGDLVQPHSVVEGTTKLFNSEK